MGGPVSIGERELRGQLGSALDGFVPGPVPMPALIRQGKAIVVRRRIVTIAAVALVIVAAAVITPLGLGNLAPHRVPVSPTHYTVTEHSVRLAHPLRMSYDNNFTDSAEIAYGRVNDRSWWVRLGVHADLVSVNSRDMTTTVDGSGYAPLNRRSGPFASLASNGGSPQIDYGIVRADVSYLRIRLTNGQTLTVRPVTAFGPRYARYVAFAVPYNSAVTEVTAYSARSELGYAIPFTQGNQLQIRWIPAGQAPPPQVSYELGSGTMAGAAWSLRMMTGPWGDCEVFSARWPGFPLGWCGFSALSRSQVVRIPVGPEPGAVPKRLPSKGSVVTPMIELAQAAPSVSYLILTRQNGTTFRAASVAAGEWRYCVFSSERNLPTEPRLRNPALAVIRWTAYNSSGHELGSGSVQQ
jgi:hypothetical protein